MGGSDGWNRDPFLRSITGLAPDTALSIAGGASTANGQNGGDVIIAGGNTLPARVGIDSKGSVIFALGGGASGHSGQSGPIVIKDDAGTGLDCAFFNDGVAGHPTLLWQMATRAGLTFKLLSLATLNFNAVDLLSEVSTSFEVKLGGVSRLKLDGAKTTITGTVTGGTLAQLQTVVKALLQELQRLQLLIDGTA